MTKTFVWKTKSMHATNAFFRQEIHCRRPTLEKLYSRAGYKIQLQPKRTWSQLRSTQLICGSLCAVFSLRELQFQLMELSGTLTIEPELAQHRESGHVQVLSSHKAIGLINEVGATAYLVPEGFEPILVRSLELSPEVRTSIRHSKVSLGLRTALKDCRLSSYTVCFEKS